MSEVHDTFRLADVLGVCSTRSKIRVEPSRRKHQARGPMVTDLALMATVRGGVP